MAAGYKTRGESFSTAAAPGPELPPAVAAAAAAEELVAGEYGYAELE